jgi:flagellar hook assembly protein FlgD
MKYLSLYSNNTVEAGISQPLFFRTELSESFVCSIIKYSLPEDSEVSIIIYDALGKEIDSITTGIQSKGSYQKTWNAEGFASGVYYVKMNAKSLSSNKTFSNVIKMLYLK